MFKSSQFIMVVSSLLFSAFYNDFFWKKVAKVYPFVSANLWYYISLFLVLSSVIYILLNLINFKWTLKPILILLFIITGFTSYLMNSYGLILDDKTIHTILTQGVKVSDLMGFKLFLNLFFYSILPSIVIYFYKINYNSLKKQFSYKIIGLVVGSVLIAVNLYSFSSFYTSFFKENKPLRYYTNPTYYIYSFGKLIHEK